MPASEQLTPFESPLPPAQNLPAQFAATISRLSTLGSALAPLPRDCTFTLVVELRDDSDALLGGSQPWIAADRGLQRRKGQGKEGGGMMTGEDEGAENEVSEEGAFDRSKAKQERQPTAEDEIASENQNPKPPKSKSRTTPVRNIEAGAFVMEVWVEEGPDKAAAIAAQVAEEERREEERG